MTTHLGAKTLFFWGAGATAVIGQPTTAIQAKYLKKLAAGVEPLEQRVRKALGKVSVDWETHLSDLLHILGDTGSDSVPMEIFSVTAVATAAMKRHWTDPADSAVETRIRELRSLFDWPALKEIIRICPGFGEGEGFQLSDLFNILDMHIQSGHGFRTNNDHFIQHSRILAARKALEMLLHTLFYIDWQGARSKKAPELEKYHQFARILAEHHQVQGIAQLANGSKTDTREFYLADIAFVSLNYDPICLWTQFIANKECNENYPPHVDIPRVPLAIFHDLAHFMAGSRIGDPSENKVHLWYPMNEASAQRLNDREHVTERRVRIEKFFFPHGCVCWRECPSCGKLTAYFGQKWDLDSAALIPPPPLKGFVCWGVDSLRPRPGTCEEKEWKEGKVDARACAHCDVLTFTQHTTTIMQSNFKGTPPPFIQEIQNDLRVAVESAEHIILFGYSLPPDDVTYRAFFAARRKKKGAKDVHCSVVVGTEYGDVWHEPDEIDQHLEDMKQKNRCEPPEAKTIWAARDLFGRKNVRFYGGGIPNVFCDGETVSKEKFARLINW